MGTLKHRIIVAGIGPGSPEYMVPAAKKAIESAKYLVGGRRALSQYAKASGGQQTCAVTRDIDGVMAFVHEGLDKADVVVMVSGDPGYFSLLDALRRTFDAHLIDVIPGISSFQLAFSRLALPWHDAQLLSFHGRVPKESDLSYAPGKKLGMLTDVQHNSKTIAETLLAHGWPESAFYAICARLSYEDETVERMTLQEAAEHAPVGSCIVVVFSQPPSQRGDGPEGRGDKQTLSASALRGRLCRQSRQSPAQQSNQNVVTSAGAKGKVTTMLGIPDTEFHRGDVPMTKEEVRILTIAKARIRPDAVVYDIGAGTGSLTIEAALQAPQGTVYAIERKPEAVALIHENADIFGVAERVHVIEAEAPDGMDALPPCDTVLIGGSGSHLAAILDVVDGKLRKGGRIALNFLTVQTLMSAIEWLRAHKTAYNYETIHVQVNRLRQVGPYDMAKAENPIYIVTAEKKA